MQSMGLNLCDLKSYRMCYKKTRGRAQTSHTFFVHMILRKSKEINGVVFVGSNTRHDHLYYIGKDSGLQIKDTYTHLQIQNRY